MAENPRASILSVGTELTEGSIQDTHGQFLSRRLRALGFIVSTIVQIPDDEARFSEELDRLAARSQLVIVTGGLGPTSDDLTREVIAAYAGADLEFHEEIWAQIVERFSGRTLPESNRKQALIPKGFAVIANPYGTAPGFWARLPGEKSLTATAGGTGDPRGGADVSRGGDSAAVVIMALPGPPRELRPLFEESVTGTLRTLFSVAPAEELRGTSFMVAESRLEDLLKTYRRPGVEWGTRAESHRIVFILRGGSADDRGAMFASLEREIGPLRLRLGEREAADLLLDALRSDGITLAAAESCTGGMIASLLTDIAGVSDSFWGGAVVYSNASKMRYAGVPASTLDAYGAVSRETVVALVDGTLEASGAGAALAVSGIAGPGGGSEEKPVGTVWIAVGMRGRAPQARHFLFSGSRDMIRRRSAVGAMLMCEGYIRNRVVDTDSMWQYI